VLIQHNCAQSITVTKSDSV